METQTRFAPAAGPAKIPSLVEALVELKFHKDKEELKVHVYANLVATLKHSLYINPLKLVACRRSKKQSHCLSISGSTKEKVPLTLLCLFLVRTMHSTW